MKVSGQEFNEEIITRIRDTVAHSQDLTRGSLARSVCEWLDWRHEDGRLKEMNCRAALLKLMRRDVLELPTPRTTNFELRGDSPEVAWTELTTTLSVVGEVELILVDGRNKQLSKLWWQMMQVHHPLGGGPLCGAQIRYLIRSQKGWLGGLSFSSAAWRLKERDLWIGWTDKARSEGLIRIVNNSRFLILPTVHVPNLASHVLSLALKRLAKDWKDRYGHEPVVVETFVDSSLFRGTCYRASNWIELGHTQGRGRQDRHYAAKLTPKKLFVYPLRNDWQNILCQGLIPTRLGETERPVTDWTDEEFGNCELGDSRLNARLRTMARDFYAQPLANLPQACGSRAKTKAAYRFLDNEDTTLENLLKSHYESTERRVAKERVVLAIQDTCELDYSAHSEAEGLGPIGNYKPGTHGMLLHGTLGFNLSGTPLGLIDAQCWTRDPNAVGKKVHRKNLPIDQKESVKWLKSYRALAALQERYVDTTFVSIGDREADIFELFHEAIVTNPNGPKLLLRAIHNRSVDNEHKHLWQTLQNQPVAGIQTVFVPRNTNRAEREAKLEIRFARVILKAPPNRKLSQGPKLSNVELYSVLATEVGGIAKEPLQWLLLTTIPVKTFEDASEKLQWYARRWSIEVYHRILKSGCRIEERQLRTADRLETCLAIDLVVAWRIFHMTKLARENPGASANLCFEEVEWKALCIYKHKVAPEQAPSLRDAVRLLASLGGFLGRKCDGEPGAQSIWRGLQRLTDIAAMYRCLTLPP